MTLPTREDIEYAIEVMMRTAATDMDKVHAIGERIKALLSFWATPGIPIGEVDIFLLGEVPGQVQRTQMHSFVLGDVYKMLPEDEDVDVPEWKVHSIRARAHVVKER